jgi:hypothetical protein
LIPSSFSFLDQGWRQHHVIPLEVARRQSGFDIRHLLRLGPLTLPLKNVDDSVGHLRQNLRPTRSLGSRQPAGRAIADDVPRWAFPAAGFGGTTVQEVEMIDQHQRLNGEDRGDVLVMDRQQVVTVALSPKDWVAESRRAYDCRN